MEDKFISPHFQIAQRSDFFSELQSVDTMQKRPLINTRDEPHADPRQWRRFHVIIGDANLSPFATRLKVGTTALVLEAILRDPRRAFPQLADPLAALPAISRDARYRWEVKLANRRPSTALAVQRDYLAAVKELCDLATPERAALVADWETVLNDLEADPMRCRDRLDWVAKLALIREFQAAQSLADDDPWLQSLDLEYHRLDFDEGLYFGLEQSGAMRGVPLEAEVQRAMFEPPETTRALVRGKLIQKFSAAVLSAQWDHVTLACGEGELKVSLLEMFAPERIAFVAQAIAASNSPADLRDQLLRATVRQ